MILLTTYTLYALYVNTYKKIDILPKEKELSFEKFTSLVYLGYKARWVDLLYKLPNNLSRFNYVFGHIFSRSLLWAGLITTVMWILIYTSKKYVSTYHNVLFIYGIIIIGCFIISYLYFRKLYKIYKALQTSWYYFHSCWGRIVYIFFLSFIIVSVIWIHKQEKK